jgi:hypothetical protein
MADDAETRERWRLGPGHVRRRIDSVWHTDAGLSALLVFVFFLLMVAPPLIGAELLPPGVFDVLFSLVVVSGVVAVAEKKWVSIGSIVLAVATLLIRWLHFGLGRTALAIVDAGLGAFTLFLFACMVLVQVLRKGRITLHRVRGAVAAYLLFGLSWAAAYQLVFVARPKRLPTGRREGSEARARVLQLRDAHDRRVRRHHAPDPFRAQPGDRGGAGRQLFPAVLIARLGLDGDQQP